VRPMGVRRMDHVGFQRHMVRFQRRDVVAEAGNFAPEVIILNSHDRSSGYPIHAGLFRWVCRLAHSKHACPPHRARAARDHPGQLSDAWASPQAGRQDCRLPGAQPGRRR